MGHTQEKCDKCRSILSFTCGVKEECVNCRKNRKRKKRSCIRISNKAGNRWFG